MKAVCLLSGGIDSPVAAKLAINKGIKLFFLHAEITDKKEKIEGLAKKLCNNPEIFYYNHSNFLKKAKKLCDNKYLCLLCKRKMYKEAEKLAIKQGADFIITGESIGQVASQTLKNIKALSQGITVPIIRPLIGLNKQEIIDLANSFSTYELSIKENFRCPFVPKQPKTNANINKLLIEEKKIKELN